MKTEIRKQHVLRVTALFCISVSLLFVAGCTQVQETAESKKIVLGAMFPLTGGAAAYGEPLSRQFMLTVDEINVAGGVHGQKIEVKLEDSMCTAKGGATAAQKLINQDGVKVIIGGACSSEILGAAVIAEQNKVILISPATTSPYITTAGEYIFRTSPSDAMAGKVAAEKAIALGFKEAAIMYENTDYPQAIAQVFAKEFEAANGKVVTQESYNPEEVDFKTQILKVKTAAPDLVYIVPQSPEKGILLIKQLREQGITQQFMTAEVLIGRDVVKEHSTLLDGLIGIEAAFDENNAIAQQVLIAYREKYGEPPWPFYQAATRDATYLIVTAIRKHGLDTAAIKNELYTTKEWSGAIGKLTINENGDPILGYSFKQVSKGAVVTLN